MNRIEPPSGTTGSQVTKRSVRFGLGEVSSAQALQGGSDATRDEKPWLRGATGSAARFWAAGGPRVLRWEGMTLDHQATVEVRGGEHSSLRDAQDQDLPEGELVR
jgi:hypothetical protein